MKIRVYECNVREVDFPWHYHENRKEWFKHSDHNENPEAQNKLSRLAGIEHIDNPYHSFKEEARVSVDYKRHKLLLISLDRKFYRENINNILKNFLKLNLSESPYLTELDVGIIIDFLKKYGYPFIPYQSNMDCDYSKFDELPWDLEEYCKYPYVTINFERYEPIEEFNRVVGSSVLYHLEEFRRYYLFFKEIYEKKVRAGNPLEGFEENFIAELFYKERVGVLLTDKIDDVSIPTMKSNFNSTFGALMWELIGLIHNRSIMSAETNRTKPIIRKCKYCGEIIIDITRQKKWGYLFPHCNECTGKYNNDIRNYKKEKYPEFKEKILSQGRARAKKKYIDDLYKLGKISEEERDKRLKELVTLNQY
jgi:hypothetical protein